MKTMRLVSQMSLLIAGLLAAVAVQAQDAGGGAESGGGGGGGALDSGKLFSLENLSLGGFIRPEVSLATGYENPNNQRGNPYNGVTEHRIPGVPTPGVPSTQFVLQNPALASDVKRPVPPSNNVFNYHIVRGELELGYKLTGDLRVEARLRSIFEPGHYSDFDAGSVSHMERGIDGGSPALYQGAPNYFQYITDGSKHNNPLEWAGPNYMVYFPALFLDYNHGPLNVRVGNQQIAWGQAIFFRVFDVPNGLDLRRHLVLDYAQEEFADKRVPSPAVRVGWQFTDSMLADAFVEKFQPTIYPNPNTPYNVIPAQFTVHDRFSDYDSWNKLSYGLRLKGNFGQWGVQAAVVRRYNPDGVFRWTKSNLNKGLSNVNDDGSVNPLAVVENTINSGVPPTQTTGALLAQTPFEDSPAGVYSANEWFHYAAMVRLNGITGLNAAVNEFAPATTSLLAAPVTTFAQAHNELDTFFTAAGGGLRGHIAREYFQQTDVMLGLSYVTEGEPGSILDQLIINLESSYTPDRVYTNTSLSRNFVKAHDSVTALVMEKYQRLTNAFPATYFVFQAMHRTKDDLFGRLLSGYGGTDTSVATGVGGGANYLVFAFQQPFPQDIYRIGFATLYDPRGGILVQPGIQWKPSGKWSFDAFYSFIDGHLSGNPNNNVLSTLDPFDEFTVRIGYQF